MSAAELKRRHRAGAAGDLQELLDSDRETMAIPNGVGGWLDRHHDRRVRAVRGAVAA
jgi:hypothetical protein